MLIPHADLLSLPKERDRNLVRQKLEAMHQIETLTTTGMPIQQAIHTTARRYHSKHGFTPKTLDNDYRRWRNGGQKPSTLGARTGITYPPRDWRMFIPNYNPGTRTNNATQNTDFCKYILQLFAETTREDATATAIRERLLDDWFAGKHIPGYGTFPQYCAGQGRAVPQDPLARTREINIPGGWSVTNIARILPSSKAARLYIQRGEKAAHDHWGDQLLRDRSRLMPLQLITFDDVRFDIRVIMELASGKAQIVHPSALFCLDVATGVILAKGIVGNYTRDEDTDGGKKGTKRGFQHADMRMLLLNVLETYGIPTNWQMRVLLENASASLSVADTRAFHKLTGIEIDTTGLIHRKLTTSGFLEEGGMPWQKGWIEAYFRLLHCRINHLPGTVGRRYELTKGNHAATEKYALKTINEALEKGIDPRTLELPILTLEQFHDLLDEYVTRLNWRIAHKLQGFCKVYEAELTPGHYIRHDHPQATQLITQDSPLTVRMEAPLERFQRLIQGHTLTPPHPHQLLPLALEKRPITVRAEKITITCAQYGNDPLIFRDQDTAEQLRMWTGKEKALLGFLNADASIIHLFTNDDNLSYICSTRRQGRIDITDEHAILCASGQVNRGRDTIREEVTRLLEPQNQRHQNMRQHNANLLASTTTQAITQAEQTHRNTPNTRQAVHQSLSRKAQKTIEEYDYL